MSKKHKMCKKDRAKVVEDVVTVESSSDSSSDDDSVHLDHSISHLIVRLFRMSLFLCVAHV